MFGNRRHNRIKRLYFDGTGVCVLAKRLERGTFHWPQSAGEPNAKLRLAPQALPLLLDGVDLKDGARRAWYEAAAWKITRAKNFAKHLNKDCGRAFE